MARDLNEHIRAKANPLRAYSKQASGGANEPAGGRRGSRLRSGHLADGARALGHPSNLGFFTAGRAQRRNSFHQG